VRTARRDPADPDLVPAPWWQTQRSGFFSGYDHAGLERIKAREVIFRGSIFGAELIKIIIRKQRPVSRLP
jgi:hypothetical protein